MSKVYVFMADGTEEVEALTVIDLLRRAAVDVVTVSIMGRKQIVSSHGIGIEADEVYGASEYFDADMLVLPGGMPGTTHLKEHEALGEVLKKQYEEGKYLAAICAAPSVLGFHGFLNRKRATCYPGFEEELRGAIVCTDGVVHDGNCITSKGLGTAIDFSLELITVLKDAQTAEKIAKAIQYR
ncbi:MAG: DJ-1/PfpI family protein [Lachnospiraceae bacterium]|nr:DJ-1/PfpI family protein [Lachnospiraceae bacterium]